MPQILAPKYGWPHKEAGKKYTADEMAFHQTISGQSRSDRGFKVAVDWQARKVLISFDSNCVDSHHKNWLDPVDRRSGLKELDPQPYWGFDDLEHKAGTKLLNSFYVQAEVKKERKREYYRYSKIMMLQTFDFKGFLKGIEKSMVYVDFDARTGHNHGTKFRVRSDYLPMLYAKRTIIL